MRTKKIIINVPCFKEKLAVASACTAMFVKSMKDMGIKDEMIAAALMVAASDMGFLDNGRTNRSV
jgi:hypothetical protein